MKRQILLFCAAAILLSCGIHEIDGPGNLPSSDKGVWGGLGDGSVGSESMRSVCYVTAMDYQKGYDWRSDKSPESVKCSLVVFADGVPIMKVPVGEVYEVSSDPDMHRIVDGHLYTDYSTDDQTIIKKDGRPLFRYDGRESLCGLGVIGEDVYTLGQSRSGEGFSFRRNGELILQRGSGSIVGALQHENDNLSFAFYDTVRNAEGESGRYYMSVNGKVSQVAVRDDIKTVWDIVACNGRAVYLASLVGLASPVIVDGDSIMSLNLPSGSSLISCRLINTELGLAANGVCRNAGGVLYDVVWLDNKIHTTFPTGKTMASLKIYGGAVYGVMNPSGKGQGQIYRCGESFGMPSGFRTMGESCTKIIDGIFHVGLSSADGRKPIIWKDGEIDSLRVNGYISSIYSEP